MGKITLKRAATQQISNITVKPKIENPDILFLSIYKFLSKQEAGMLCAPGDDINSAFLSDLNEQGWKATIFRTTGKPLADRPISEVSSGKWMYCFKNAPLSNTESYMEGNQRVRAGLTGGWWQANPTSEICFVMFAPDPKILFRKRVVAYFKDSSLTEIADIISTTPSGSMSDLTSVYASEPFRILREMNDRTKALYDIPKVYAKVFHNSVWVKYGLENYIEKILMNVFSYNTPHRVIGRTTTGGSTEETPVDCKEGIMNKVKIKDGSYPFATFGVTNPVDSFYEHNADIYNVMQRGTVNTTGQNAPLQKSIEEVNPIFEALGKRSGHDSKSGGGDQEEVIGLSRFNTRAYGPIPGGTRNWQPNPKPPKDPEDDEEPTAPMGLPPVYVPRNKRGLIRPIQTIDDAFLQQEVDEGRLTPELVEKLKTMDSWNNLATIDEIQEHKTGNTNWSTMMFNSMIMKRSSVALSFAKIVTNLDLIQRTNEGNTQQNQNDTQTPKEQFISLEPGATLNYAEAPLVMNVVVKFPDGAKPGTGSELLPKGAQPEGLPAHVDLFEYDIDGDGTPAEIHIFMERVDSQDGFDMFDMLTNFFEKALNCKIEKSSGGLANAPITSQKDSKWKSFLESEVKNLNNDIDALILKLKDYKVVFDEVGRPKQTPGKAMAIYSQELEAYKAKLELYDMPKEIDDINSAIQEHNFENGSFDGLSLSLINFVKLIKE